MEVKLASCFDLLSSGFFTKFKLEINNASTSDELQSIIDEGFEQLSYLESTITSQEEIVSAINELLSAPTDLSSVITWITSLIDDVLTPMYAPYTIYVSQLAQLTTEIAELTTLINTVASEKFPSVTINIPDVSVICTL